MTRRRRAAVMLVAALVGGCTDDDAGLPATAPVQDLEIPTDAGREAAEQLRQAESLVRAGRLRFAEPILRRVLELTPDDARAAELFAQCLIARGALREAVPYLRVAVAGAPRQTRIRSLLQQVLLNLGDAAAAETAALEWTENEPLNGEAWFELGRAYYRLERFPDAIAAFQRSEKILPARADIRSELGLAFAAAGQLGRAETKQRDAIDRQPEHAEAWFRLGDVIARRDPARAAEAAEALDRAVTLQPAHVLGHLYLFRVCRLPTVAEGDPLGARGETAWKAVLRLHGRAQVADSLGGAVDRDEATSEFALQEKVTLAPDDPAPRAALARFLHGERRWDEAIDAYRLAIASGGGDTATRTQLAGALLGHGDAAAAEAELRTALAAAPDDVAVRRLLAWVLLVQGRDADAAAAAEHVLTLAPDDLLARKTLVLARMHAGDVDAGLRELASLGWL